MIHFLFSHLRGYEPQMQLMYFAFSIPVWYFTGWAGNDYENQAVLLAWFPFVSTAVCVGGSEPLGVECFSSFHFIFLLNLFHAVVLFASSMVLTYLSVTVWRVFSASELASVTDHSWPPLPTSWPPNGSVFASRLSRGEYLRRNLGHYSLLGSQRREWYAWKQPAERLVIHTSSPALGTELKLICF